MKINMRFVLNRFRIWLVFYIVSGAFSTLANYIGTRNIIFSLSLGYYISALIVTLVLPVIFTANPYKKLDNIGRRCYNVARNQETNMNKLHTFFKQLFCSHIWKDGDFEIIRERVRVIGITPIANVTFVAQKQKCLLCEKEQTVELRQYTEF